MDNDGIVKEGEATITGATYLATFQQYNHFEIMKTTEVAEKAAEILRYMNEESTIHLVCWSTKKAQVKKRFESRRRSFC